MKKKMIWKILALACAGAMLAGCGSAGTPTEGSVLESTADGKESAEEVGKEEASKEEAAEDASEKDMESASEGTVEHVARKTENMDPMQLKTAYERAAYFADWAYLKTQGNTLVSPMSLNLALGLAAEGASGETARELAQYFGREDYSSYVDEYMKFAESLTVEDEPEEIIADEETGMITKVTRIGGTKYTFRYEIANSLWVNDKKRLQENYRNNVEKLFRAKAAPADFTNNTAQTVDAINDWCNEKTHGLIPSIITERDIDPELMAILINSLYFESPWAEKWSLREHSFKDFSGKETTQEMLIGKGNAYYENDQAIAFSKAYYNGFQFIGILPKEEGEFSVLNLDLESLLNSRTTDYVVTALMPKLNFSTTADNLQNLLISEGITVPFDSDQAEFDKIIEGEELHISRIIQKCKIELDENGTKAAAVTAVMMRANGIAMEEPERKEVYLDRPFAFMIYDSVNDEIVFVGKVTEAE